MQALRVPSYLPAIARPLLPGLVTRCLQAAGAYHVSLEDLWDETITALLRATVHYDPSAGPFGPYARTAVHRALAKACQVGMKRRRVKPHLLSLEHVPDLELTTESPETLAIATETIQSYVPVTTVNAA